MGEDEGQADDAYLVGLCQRDRGSATTAFAALVRRYESRVFATCLRLMGNHADAEDVSQEVFVRVFRKLHRFEGRSSFSTWLFTITRNECFSALKKRAATVTLAAEAAVEETTPRSAPGADCGLEQSDLLHKTLARLSADDRDILISRFVSDLQIDEIAIVHGLSLSAAKMRLYRAMARFSAIANGAPGAPAGPETE